MSEPAERTWTMTFPIEATAFVVALIIVTMLSAGVFLIGGLRVGNLNRGVGFGGGGFVDQPMPMPAFDTGEMTPVTTFAP